jgi:hypothetical protein
MTPLLTSKDDSKGHGGGISHPLVPTHGCQPDITIMLTSPFSRSETVFFFRLSLYNRSLPCGAKAIRQKMESERISPPSIYQYHPPHHWYNMV